MFPETTAVDVQPLTIGSTKIDYYPGDNSWLPQPLTYWGCGSTDPDYEGFVNWLTGFMAACGERPTKKQWRKIREKLQEVNGAECS